MKFSPLLSDLIKSLQVLPGVGPKTAKRMAMSLLGGNEADAKNLANNLSRAIDLIGTCQNCRVLSEDQICPICNDSSRDSTQVCVVENTSQVVQIEELGGFRGIYFVLGGYLSPIEGRGPNEIGLSELNSKALSGEIKELILAFNSSLEGEATAQYILEKCSSNSLKITKLAQGVPLGGDLNYVDSNTLRHAFDSRQKLV